MNYTNIYLGFLRIKDDEEIQKKFEQLNGIKKKGDLEANKQIKKFMEDVYVTGYKENISDLPTAKNLGYSQYLKMVRYRDYKFLYVEYKDWCVWINYEKQDADICKPRRDSLWDYLPNLENQTDKFVNAKGNSCYIINTYQAYISYVEDFLGMSLNKNHNYDFYRDLKEVLATKLPDYFYTDRQELYCRMRAPEGVQTFSTIVGDKTLYAKILFVDNMVIALECQSAYNAKITVVKEV